MPLTHVVGVSIYRAYVSGLSDEAGWAANVAMAVKQLGAGANVNEISMLEEFVELTLEKKLQNQQSFAVVASLLYFERGSVTPPQRKFAPNYINHCESHPPYWQTCWDKKRAAEAWST